MLFLQSLGFDKYKGGLDTVHDLTGLYSIFTRWRGIEIMFHVSTHLPNEPMDHQKVQKLYSITVEIAHHHYGYYTSFTFNNR